MNFVSYFLSGVLMQIKKRLQHILMRHWWFDVLYPLGLAVLLFSSFTYTVYSGKRQMRYALEVEGKLLETSLKLSSGRPIKDKKQIATVSLDAIDQNNFSRNLEFSNFNTDSLAKIISHFDNPNLRLVVIEWPEIVSANIDFDKLLQSLQSLHPQTSVLFAVPSNISVGLPEELLDEVEIVNDWPCANKSTFQAICSYSKNWNTWVIPGMLNQLGEAEKSYDIPPWAYYQFASGLPGYILNLSSPDEFTNFNFRQINDHESSNIVANPIAVFIGNDFRSSNLDKLNSELVQTAYSGTDTKLVDSKTPLHLYWAQIAQMYLDNEMVYLPSKEMVYVISILFSIAICLILWKLGGIAALGMYIVFVGIGPFANAISMKYLNVYIPLFDAYYFGISTFIFVGFGRLSYSAFKNWKLEEERRIHTRMADLKSNFISLLSHNLNTPVAKMQGMLGLLSGQPSSESWKPDIKKAEYHVTILEYCIRGVLIASALEEFSLNEVPRNLTSITEEFTDQRASSLQRLGLKLEVLPPGFEDEDQLFVPFHYDLRVLTAACAALCSLFANESEARTVQMQFSGFEPTNADRKADDQMTITVTSENSWLSSLAQSILNSSDYHPIRKVTGDDFFTEIQARLVAQLALTYFGNIKVTPKGKGGSVSVCLYDAKGRKNG